MIPLLEAAAILLGLAALGFILLLDRPEEVARVSRKWLDQHREEEDHQ